MTLETVSIAPSGKRWAVKHNGGFLGYAGSRAEALRLARSLLDWLDADGKLAELVVEERSWAPPERMATRQAV